MTILVLNPNSSPAVTARIDAAMAPLRPFAPVPIEVACLSEGPAGIETQAEVDAAATGVLNLARGRSDLSALVIACFSDPGLNAARAELRVPVIGIAEAAVLTAMQIGQGPRFGILAIKRGSVARHLRMLGAMGVLPRLAADRALDLGVADLSDEERTFARMQQVGRRLVDDDGADVLILGCAGMTAFRSRLEADLGVPVVEPCTAAAALAIGRLALGAAQISETR